MKSNLALILLLTTSTILCASSDSIKSILEIGPEGKGNSKAAEAWSKITENADVNSLIMVFDAMDEAGPIASNWLRSAAEVIAKKLEGSGQTTIDPLGEYFMDKTHPPKARRFAFELIKKNEPITAKALIPGLLNDPSPELRRDAVSLLIDQASALKKEEKQSAAILIYRQALNAAVEENQVKPISKSLKELGVEVDLPKHFGFLMRWNVIGPFDNTSRKGFETIFPPEKEINFNSKYKGKEKQIEWQPLASSDSLGKIDLNKPFGMLKETTAYAYTEFESKSSRTAELRLGCKNAWKIWVNGKFIFGRDEYHRGQRIDQYKLKIQLKEGKNTILVKACQNEQTEEWTVQWEFQLRICDEGGVAILASNREPTPQSEKQSRRPRRPKS